MDIDLTTHKGLISDIVKAVGGEQRAIDALDQAKDKQKTSGDTSIRALAKVFSGINSDLEDLEGNSLIPAIAEAAADKISKGNSQVKKSRKSELVTMLGQREHMSGMILELDNLVAERQEKDPKFTYNIRAGVLKGLRALKAKSNDIDTPEEARNLIEAALDVVPSDADKVKRHITAIVGMKAVKKSKDVKRVLSAIEAIFNTSKPKVALAALTAILVPIEEEVSPIEEEFSNLVTPDDEVEVLPGISMDAPAEAVDVEFDEPDVDFDALMGV